MNLGAHLSIAKSLDLAVDRAASIKADSLQIFPSPPRSWKKPSYSREVISKFNLKRRRAGIKNVFIHEIYLTNLASSDSKLLRRSFESLKFAGELAVKINADGVIFHPGSAGKNKKRLTSCRQVAENVDKLIKLTGSSYLYENTAGGGGTLGFSLEELSFLLANTSQKNKVGVCLDTCHLHAGLYPIAGKAEILNIIKKINSCLSSNSIKVVHLNNSKYPAGSRRDVHADIEKGTIKLNSLKNIVKNKLFSTKPFIMETPSLKKLSGTKNGDSYLDFVKNILK